MPHGFVSLSLEHHAALSGKDALFRSWQSRLPSSCSNILDFALRDKLISFATVQNFFKKPFYREEYANYGRKTNGVKSTAFWLESCSVQKPCNPVSFSKMASSAHPFKSL